MIKIFFQIILNKLLNPQCWHFCKWIKWWSAYIKSINRLSNGKWTLTQTEANKPKVFFSRKIKISHPSLCLDKSIILETHKKNTLQISCSLINIWGIFESNYHQSKQSWQLQKLKKALLRLNNFVQSLSETTFRLWWHDLW